MIVQPIEEMRKVVEFRLDLLACIKEEGEMYAAVGQETPSWWSDYMTEDKT